MIGEGHRAQESEADSFRLHRQRLLAHSFPLAALVAFCVTLLYACGDFISNPQFFSDIHRVVMALAIPLVAFLLSRGPLAHQVAYVALAFDVSYTSVLATGLLNPANTISGTALFLALKMVGTALLFRWSPRVQTASVAFTLVIYFILMPLSGRVSAESLPPIHQLIGPLIAGFFSVIGAYSIDQTHRQLFLRTVKLSHSETQLRVLLDTERAIADLAREISILSDRPTLLERINRLTVEALTCEFSTTFLVDEHGKELAGTSAHFTVSPPMREQALAVRIPMEHDVARELRDGRPVIINHPQQQHWAPPAELERFHVHRVAMMPIIAKGKLLGALSAGSSQPGQPFSDRELALLRGVAAQAAVAIENSQLFDSTQHLLQLVQESSRLQTEFVANMSHELRTPLNVIIGFTDLLLSDNDLCANVEQHSSVERIAISARALHRLVESVLEYARLNRGGTTLLIREFSADTLLSELRELCADIGMRPEVEAQIPHAPGVVLHTDYDRLYSALSNLVLNALKFTPAGTVALHVVPDGDHIEFKVQDTGIGIPTDQLPYVFEPFRQVDGSPTRSFGGVGLGLAVVRRNTELLGGTVRVESQCGVGSTFRLFIPARVAPDETARVRTAKPPVISHRFQAA